MMNHKETYSKKKKQSENPEETRRIRENAM